MSTTGKEYRLAIRIAGIVDASLGTSLATAKSSLRSTVSSVNSDFTKLDKTFNKIMKVGKVCFTALAASAAVAAVAIAKSISVGSEFEESFAGVKKTVEATDLEYNQLRKDILAMAEEIPSTTSEIADVMETAGQLGIATESLSDFTEVMINLGVACEDLDADEAASQLAKFANITGMTNYDEYGVSNYERLGSTITDLGNNFATTEADIVSMATNMASAASLVGMSEAEIMGWATAMTSVGLAANRGGSSLSKLIKKISVAVETGSEDLTDYASVANMTVSDFSNLFENDASSALEAFISGLNDTERNGKSTLQILNDMGLTEIRLSDTIQRLAGSEDNMHDALTTASEAWEENTALTVEAEKKYATFDSQVQLLKNSFSNLGIAIYDNLSRGPVLDFIQSITTAVNNLADTKLNTWLDNIEAKLPTIQNAAQQVWESIKQWVSGFSGVKEALASLNISGEIGKIADVASGVVRVISVPLNLILNVASWCLEHPTAISALFTGLGAALVAYKIESTVVHTVNSLMSLSSLNPVTLVLLGLTAAIGGVTAAVTAYKEHQQDLVDDNLAEHFGDIALSMEDIEYVAEQIINSGNLTAVKNALAQFDELDGLASTMEDSVADLEKFNWELSIGIDLSEDDMTSYQEAVTEYIEAAEDYALQSEYAVHLNLATAFGEDSEVGESVTAAVEQFYSDSYGELTELGTELSDVVTDAFEDGFLDIDEANAIAELQSQMADITSSLATSEFDAQLSLLDLEYGGGDLTAESFQNLQEELAEQVATASEAYKEAYTQNYASIQAAYDAGNYLTEQEYQNAIDELQQEYINQVTELSASSINFQIETIMEQYADELDPAIEEYIQGINDIISNTDAYDTEDWYSAYTDLYTGLYDAMSSTSLDEETAAAISQLLELMQPSVDDLNETVQAWTDAGGEISEAASQALSDFDMLTIMTGDADVTTEAYTAGQQIAESGLWDSFYSGMFESAEEAGVMAAEDYNIVGSMAEGAADAAAAVSAESIDTAAATVVEPAVEGMYAWSQETIDEYYSQGFEASANVKVTLNPTITGLSSTNFSLSVTQHAMGGIVRDTELSWLAEKGPEAVIPLDSSENAKSLWRQTGQLLGMDSLEDKYDIGGDTNSTVQYSPTLQFYGGTPSRQDLDDALELSQEKFNEMMAQYMKTQGRVSY